jgi:hypothetical protein
MTIVYICSTIQDTLIQLKFNLDVFDISTYGIYRSEGENVRLCMYHERVKDVMEPSEETSQEVSENNDGDQSKEQSDPSIVTKKPDIRLLFRSWIHTPIGVFSDEVNQHNSLEKLPTTALWLQYTEAVFNVMTGNYLLTEDESIILGCLKMQVIFMVNPIHLCWLICYTRRASG